MNAHKHLLALLGCLLCGATLFARSESLPIDKDVITGRLDNGITYMIRHNANPRHQACFYLVNGIGALAEKPGQHGMAHYLEHMMFQGTRHFPGRGMVDMLERHGVIYGYDLNARTSEDETVYTLSNVPTHDTGLLDSCLMVMADWTYALQLDDARIEHERGPILKELAMRDTPQEHIQTQWAGSLLAGSAYEGHDVMGTTDDIKAITPQGLKDFYASWHNPAMNCVVVVGDFDAGKMEQALHRTLSEAPMGDKKQRRPFFDIPERDSLNYCLATDKGATSESVMVINIVRDTPEAGKTSAAYLLKGIVARLVNIMGATRMNQTSHGQGSPFQGAGISALPLKRGYFTFQIGASMGRTGNEARGIRMLLLEHERLRQVGFTQAELDRARASMLRENRQDDGGAKTNDEIAKMLEQHYLEGEPLVDYKAWYAYERNVIDTLSLATVNAMLRGWSSDKNMSVVVTGPDGSDYPTRQDVLDIFDQVRKIDYSSYSFELAPEEELPVLMADKPQAGRVVRQKTDDAKGLTTWKLSNGVTAIYKQVPDDHSQVCLRAVRPGGESKFAIKELPSAQMATRLVEAGGVGGLDNIQLQRLQKSLGFSCESRINGYSERMNGKALPASVEQMLQLMYLRFTRPATDSATISRAVAQERVLSLLMSSSLQDTIALLRSGGSERVIPKRIDYYDNVNAQSVQSAWSRCFGSAKGFTFVLTGSQPADSIKPLVECYIASLPTGGKGSRWVDNKMYGYSGITEKTVGSGIKGINATVIIAVSGQMPYTPANELQNSIAARILQQRAMEQMREKEGDVYTVNVGQTGNPIPRGSFEVSCEFQADTLQAVRLRDKVYGIWRQMAARGVTSGEVSKNLAYFSKAYDVDNGKADKWADTLADQVIDGCELLNPDNYAASAAKVTAESLSAFIRTLDGKQNVMKLIVR